MSHYLYVLYVLLQLTQSVNVEITNHPDISEWWVAFYISGADESCSGPITSVAIKDRNHYPSWTSVVTNEWGFYAFENTGNPFTTPISIEINTSSQKITANNILPSFTGNLQTDFGSNFCSSPPPSSSSPPSNNCAEANVNDIIWKTNEHKIQLNGNDINIRGIAWFGAEGNGYIPGGLATWYGDGGHSYIWYLDLIKESGFNAIRLPFSQYGVEYNSVIEAWAIDTAGNEIFNGKTILEGLDIIIDAAAQRGLLIMLDFHSIYTNGGGQDKFWDVNQRGIKLWRIMADRFADKWNIFMIDIFNEPYDVSNSEWNDYKLWSEVVGNTAVSKTNWLIGIQGTNPECFRRKYPSSSGYYCYWGENLQSVESNPIELFEDNRVVYLPHVYGPSITDHNGQDPIPYGDDIWDDHWGYIGTSDSVNGAPVMVGEWGSKYNKDSYIMWMDSLVKYLKSIDATDNFFWCLNENSVDTGGILLSDWTNVDEDKLAKLNELQPNPTEFTYNSIDDTVCWQNI